MRKNGNLKLKIILFPVIFFGVLGFAKISLAANYYVSPSGNDSNPGTQTQPWQTIQKSANTMITGDTVYVQAGTYNETVAPSNSGTSGNIISYIAQGAAKVRKWVINSKDYILLDRFANDGTYNYGNYIFVVSIIGTSNHVTMQNFNLSMPNDTSCSNQSGFVQTGPDTSYITITGNTLSGSCYYPAVNPMGSHNTYSNNVLTELWTDGFQTGGPFSDSTISGNTIGDFHIIGLHNDCFQVFGDGGDDTTNIIFENNICKNGDQPFFLTKDIADTTGITIRNNIFYNFAGDGGISIPGTVIYNNVFWRVGFDKAVAISLSTNTSLTAGDEIKNNFFIGCGDGVQTPDYGAGYDRPYTETGSSNNYYAKSPTAAIPWGTQYFSTPEPNYINGGNPVFVNYTNNDFHLQATSPAKDRGTTISSFATDKDGITRPQGSAWDIGAYEYAAASPPPDTTPPEAPTNVTVQ